MKEIEFKEDIVKRNKIPLLIYAPEWIQLFSNYKSRSMQKSIKRLEELLSREKDCEAELRNLEKRKKQVMNKILYLSKDINENKDVTANAKMDEAQKELLSINKRIPDILEERETLPILINEQNTKLLKDTIMRAYELINESEAESERYQKELSELRNRLATLIQKKVDTEERINRLYSFIHGMIGAAEMENLDESFLTR